MQREATERAEQEAALSRIVEEQVHQRTAALEKDFATRIAKCVSAKKLVGNKETDAPLGLQQKSVFWCLVFTGFGGRLLSVQSTIICLKNSYLLVSRTRCNEPMYANCVIRATRLNLAFKYNMNRVLQSDR